MPRVVCPHCRCSSLRSGWLGLERGVPFTIVCPMCAVAADVDDVAMRLRPPGGVPEEQRMASLALRVASAVRSLVTGYVD
jgi:hypothetical protein